MSTTQSTQDPPLELYLHPETIKGVLEQPEKKKERMKRVVKNYLRKDAKNGKDGVVPSLTVPEPEASPPTKEWSEGDSAVEDNEEKAVEESNIEFEREKELFELAVARYSERFPDAVNGVDIKDVHNMSDVLALIEKARDKRERGTSEANLWSKMRSAFKKSGKHEKAIASWLELLPNGNAYLSLVVGGLKLIIGMAAELHNLNEDIVDLVCEIPTILKNNRRLQDINLDSESDRFLSLNVNVHTYILRALKLILKYHEKSSLRRGGAALFRQDSYEMPLRTALENIRKARAALKEEVEIRSHIILRDLQRSSTEDSKLVQIQTRDRQKELALMQAETIQAKKDRKDANRDREELRKEWSHERQKNEVERSDRRQFVKWVERQVYSFLSASPALVQAQDMSGGSASDSMARTSQAYSAIQETGAEKDHPQRRRRNEAVRVLSNDESTAQLKSRLTYNKRKIRKALSQNLDTIYTLQQHEQDRANFVLGSDALACWLRDAAPAVLLINGNSRSFSSQFSPIAFVCAKIADAFRQVRLSQSANDESRVIELHYFCETRTRWGANVAGNSLAALANSLIYQMLSKSEELDCNKISSFEREENEDVGVMSQVFVELIEQLGPDTHVFCMIDGLDYFTNPSEQVGANDLLIRLLKLMKRLKKDGDGCQFKLLLTTSTTLKLTAADAIFREDILTVPDDCGRLGGFKDSEWNSGLGTDINALFEPRSSYGQEE